jgi:hypothetical protein
MTMRKLTICLIAFAVAFSLCGIAFRSVIAANGRMGQVPAQASSVSDENTRVFGGIRAIHDSELY